MIGRFVRADEVNDALHAWTTRTRADEVVAACVEARVPGDDRRQRRRAAALRAARGARGVRAAAGRGVDPAARAVPVPRRRRPRARRAPARPAAVARRGTRRVRDVDRTRSASGRSPGVRVLDFTAFWAGPFATAWLAAMGADVIKVEAVQRPDGIRFSAAVRPARGPAVLREVGAVPRVEPRQARHHARPRPSRRARAREAARRAQPTSSPRTSRRGCSSGSASTTTTVRALRPDVVMLRMPAFGLDRAVARPRRLRADDGAAHRHGVGDRLRRRPADHPRRPRRPDGRHARRARDRRRARAPRRAPARGSSSRCRWSRSRPR